MILSSSPTLIQFNPLSSASLLAGACKHTHPYARPQVSSSGDALESCLATQFFSTRSLETKCFQICHRQSLSDLTTTRHSALCDPTSYLIALHHSFLISCPLWDFSNKSFAGHSLSVSVDISRPFETDCSSFTSLWIIPKQRKCNSSLPPELLTHANFKRADALSFLFNHLQPQLHTAHQR